jgi:ubiquinone/menaquinone biosynthesis C-methylase UbiE
MIAFEDVDGNLPRLLVDRLDIHQKKILDLGTGTGRLPILLSGRVERIVGLDLHREMLIENAKLRREFGQSWPLVQADMRKIPFQPEAFDLTIAGWAIGHLRGWFEADWQDQIRQVLLEMRRVTRADGALVIIETLGTGSVEPAPPSPQLAEYYRWLEVDWGFTRDTIPTDYLFPSVRESIARTEFFFGPTLANTIAANRWRRLPEWTGVWIRWQ